MSIDTIIALIQAVIESANAEKLLPLLEPFVPQPVYIVIQWAMNHTDCLVELFAALRGAFGDVENSPLSEIAGDIEAVRALCDE